MTSPEPCRACPWRLSNQGKRHPDGWYTKKNLNRLWAQLRKGEGMSCHPTDPGNPVSDAAQAQGYKPAPETAEVRECAGALILQQREMMVLQQEHESLKQYRKVRPRGLTLEGVWSIANRAMFGGTPLGGSALPKPDLNHADIGLVDLPWEPRR